MGEYKWEQLGYDYLLKNTPPATPELVKTAKKIFQEYGITVYWLDQFFCSSKIYTKIDMITLFFS